MPSLKIYFLDNYQLDNIDDSEVTLVQGDKNSKELELHFASITSENIVDFGCRVIFERPDGTTSNAIYATPVASGYFKILLNEWVMEQSGILKVTSIIKEGTSISGYGIANLSIATSVMPSSDTITISQAQYDAFIQNLNDLANKDVNLHNLKVSKSGDIMTGDLILSNNLLIDVGKANDTTFDKGVDTDAVKQLEYQLKVAEIYTELQRLDNIKLNVADLVADFYTRSETDDLLNQKSDLGHLHYEANIVDLNKYTQEEVDTLLNGKANLAHTHNEVDIVDLDKYTKVQVDTKLAEKADVVHQHNEVDIVNLNKYTKEETDALLLNKSDVGHAHSESDITNLNKYTQEETDALLAQKADLDGNGKVPLNQLPDESKSQTYVVTTYGNLPSTNLLAGDKAFVTGTGDSYIYDGTNWVIMADADWNNVSLDWVNIVNPPVQDDNSSLAGVQIYAKVKVDDLLALKSNVGHTHVEANITDLDKYTKDEVDAKDATKANVVHTHSEADIVDLDKYTQVQVNDLLALKAELAHNHTESDITDLDKYTQAQVDNLLSNKANVIHEHVEGDITNLDKYSQSEVNSLLTEKINLNGQNSNLEILKFIAGLGIASVTYNNDVGVLEVESPDGTKLQVGGEIWFVNGKTNVIIQNAELLQYDTPQGGHYIVKPVNVAELNANPHLFVGMATKGVGVGDFVKSTWFGEVSGVDLPSETYSVGDILYYDNVNGGLRIGEPLENPVIEIATVVKVNDNGASTGRLLVRPTIKTNHAKNILLQDSKGYYSAETVEKALEESFENFNNYIPLSQKGVANGVATLDNGGKIPAVQLPSYVDDVIEGYYNIGDLKFYQEETYVNEITGETGKIYADLGSTAGIYRWANGTFYEMIEAVAFGTTAGTAYEGNSGQANRNDINDILDGTKIVDKTYKDENGNNIVLTYATKNEVSNLSKSDVGLSSVENYGIASQLEAEAGTLNTKYMTPLRTKQAITKNLEVIEGGEF